ncbi:MULTISPECIES: UDP-glucose/GDP-mannose dehydrogenase family protein [unclassified Streptomyces]|uniref:UDP-glucose dehydrogenase family protein n=1 Tax=unclassified Streptomyces TaxID=2593676 RepID=UPI000B50C6F3|nr:MULTISPECIES: UDP-glucose/GDP-mannose dehydrogenase family protein [unclassified Streptomyces]MYX05021.1 nucleotide sugar dehydrogenase [Streptomyces sp. SID8378]SNB90701.1 UDPglucose 6-dehydrogenase [Streptomyces sp. PgraA7]
MRMTVIGTGYVGTVHAACMAAMGHEVLGIDVDADRIASLAAGRAPIREAGLDELLARTVKSGRLRFSTSLAEGAAFSRTHFVCVGTPQRPDGEAADLRCVDAVTDELARHLRPGSLVVGKSTVPVGTAARLGRRIAAVVPDAEVAWNPEFLREGSAVQDSMRPERIVVGVTSAHAESVLRTLYTPLLRAGAVFFSTDTATAELVKVAANSFLATKISFINAMAEVCDAAGADVTVLAAAVGADSRIGELFLEPGLGFGGSCFPKDIRAFAARAEEIGAGEAVAFLHEVDRINTRQRERTVSRARRLVGGSFADRRVAVLGASFKPGSDDVRDSPSLAVAASVAREGATVRVHDPQALDNARAALPDPTYTLDIPKACEQADLVLHLTPWPEYQQIDPRALVPVVRHPVLLDARNSLDARPWRAAGWSLHALGDPTGGTS